jgi:ankyrin repeat protein
MGLLGQIGHVTRGNAPKAANGHENALLARRAEIVTARQQPSPYTEAVKKDNAFGCAANRGVVVVILLILFVLLVPAARAQEPPPATAEFFDAIKANDTNRVAQMLQSNTNLTRANYYGQLPLHVAAPTGRGEIVALLLKHGADINAPGDTLATSNMQLTALDAAIWSRTLSASAASKELSW